VNGQWYRGGTDTSGECDVAIPQIRTPDDTVRAMMSFTGPGREDECEALLAAALNHNATSADVEAVFGDTPDADVATAINQLSLAGLLAE
jgi:hypothetical protein